MTLLLFKYYRIFEMASTMMASSGKGHRIAALSERIMNIQVGQRQEIAYAEE